MFEASEKKRLFFLEGDLFASLFWDCTFVVFFSWANCSTVVAIESV